MKIQSALTATALAGILVLGTDYLSFASTGGSFLLGKANSANHTTSLTNSGAGAVLQLKTTKPATRPPLRVNSKVKVAKLNADFVDGMSAAQLGVRTLVYEKAFSLPGVSGYTLTLPAVPAGNYLGTMSGWVYGPATSNMECFIRVPSTGRLHLNAWRSSDGRGFYPLSSAGVVSVPTTQNLKAECTGDLGTYNTFPSAPLQVSLTRIDTRIDKTSTAARQAPLPRASR